MNTEEPRRTQRPRYPCGEMSRFGGRCEKQAGHEGAHSTRDYPEGVRTVDGAYEWQGGFSGVGGPY